MFSTCIDLLDSGSWYSMFQSIVLCDWSHLFRYSNLIGPFSSSVIAGNLLLVDEIMRAGLSSLKG